MQVKNLKLKSLYRMQLRSNKDALLHHVATAYDTRTGRITYIFGYCMEVKQQIPMQYFNKDYINPIQGMEHISNPRAVVKYLAVREVCLMTFLNCVTAEKANNKNLLPIPRMDSNVVNLSTRANMFNTVYGWVEDRAPTIGDISGNSTIITYHKGGVMTPRMTETDFRVHSSLFDALSDDGTKNETTDSKRVREGEKKKAKSFLEKTWQWWHEL